MKFIRRIFYLAKNPLYLLIAAQASFIVLGKTALDFSVGWADVLTALVVAILAELLFSYIDARLQKNPYVLRFPASAAAAALGIGIFFRATSPWYFALAAIVAIGSKYIIRIKGKHIFNPSNIGVVVMVFAFPYAATIEFTQWGNNVWVYIIIAEVCFYISYVARVWVTTLSFLISYSVLLFVSLPYHLDILVVHHYGIIGPSLVLFASFMITDPRTAPTGTYPRILHGVAVAAAFFLLELIGLKYSLFVASFLTALLGVGSAYIAIAVARTTGRIVPKNMFACLALVCVMGYAYTTTITHNGVFGESGFSGMSPSFLFMGVESFSITQCAENPIFVPDPILNAQPSMTTGIAWGDYDQDGREDLFVSSIDVPSQLFRNTPQGFTDITAQVGLPSINSQSAFFADYNNDGQRDLFVVYGMPNYLAASQGQPIDKKSPVAVIRVFKNTGKHFTEATDALGLSTFTLPPGGGTLSFGDYNNDRYLDFVYAERATFKDLSNVDNIALLKSMFEPRIDTSQRLDCDPAVVETMLQNANFPTLPTKAAQTAYTQGGGCLLSASTLALHESSAKPQRMPQVPFSIVAYRPGLGYLFENKEGARFVEHPQFAAQLKNLIASSSGKYFHDGQHPYNVISGSFYQPVSFDYNNDRLPDIYMSLDWGSNLLLRNDGHFMFSNTTSEAGVDYAGTGMGVAVSDYNSDGALDIAAGNIRRIDMYEHTATNAFVNKERLFNLNQLGVAWGMSFLDYNLDGSSDLFVGNGGVEMTSNVPWLDLSRPLYRSDRLYLNTGNGTGFENVSSSAFCPADGKLTRPVAVADYDLDGYPDIAVGYFALGAARTPPTLYRNTGTGAHYLEIELKGTSSNADAVGAVVSVTSGGHTQTEPLILGSSFYAENSHKLIFGLGSAKEATSIDVRWPSGKRTHIANVAANQILVITEER